MNSNKLRSVNTKFWDDGYIADLDPIEKLLFLYFLTNPLTNLAGIYEIPLKRIGFDTGIDKEMVLKILERFERDGKIYYRKDYIILANFYKNQNYNPSMLRSAKNYIKTLPDDIIDTVKVLEQQPVRTLLSKCGQIEGEVEGEGEIEIEGEGEDEEAVSLKKLEIHFQDCIRIPRYREKLFIKELLTKFGYKKSREIIDGFADKNFRSLETMRNALTDEGDIKPKDQLADNKVYTFNEALGIDRDIKNSFTCIGDDKWVKKQK